MRRHYAPQGSSPPTPDLPPVDSAELKALDALPPTIRRAIMYSPARHSPVAILKALRGGDACEWLMLQAIELKNAQMCADYRRAMARGFL